MPCPEAAVLPMMAQHPAEPIRLLSFDVYEPGRVEVAVYRENDACRIVPSPRAVVHPMPDCGEVAVITHLDLPCGD